MRRRYATPLPLTGARVTGYRLTRIFALLGVLTLAGWGFLASKLAAGLESFEFVAHADGFVLGLEALGIIAFGDGLLVSLWNLWVVFTKRSRWFAKIWALLLPVAFAGFGWALLASKAMNFSVGYRSPRNCNVAGRKPGCGRVNNARYQT